MFATEWNKIAGAHWLHTHCRFTLEEVAEIYSVSPSTIYRNIEKPQWKRRYTQLEIPQDLLESICRDAIQNLQELFPLLVKKDTQLRLPMEYSSLLYQKTTSAGGTHSKTH